MTDFCSATWAGAVPSTSFTKRSAAAVHVPDDSESSVHVRLTILLGLAAAVSRAGAQLSTPIADPSADTLGFRSASVAPPQLGRNTALLMTGALGAGVALSLVDSRVLSGTQPAPGELQRTSAIGSLIGGPGPIALGALLYAAGRGTGDAFVTNAGREVMHGVLVTGGLTALAKGIVGRSRPFASPGDADEYAPGRGFLGGARSSFPSGHTAAAFATATILARELGKAHPTGRWVLNPLLFGAASFVGWSRVYDRQHWPSDVVVGAALGSIAGYEVVAHAHGERSPITGPLFSHLRLGPSQHGTVFGWSVR